MPRLVRQARRVPLPLALLLAVAACLSMAWALSTPPLQGPDEDQHVAYVEYFAETGHFPSATGGKHAFAPDLAYALDQLGYARMLQARLARPPWQASREHDLRAFEDGLPAGALGTGDGPISTAKNPPLYYVLESAAWKLTPGGHLMGRLFALRLMGVLWLLAMVCFAWLMAGEAFARRLPQTVAAAVVALLPMCGYMSGIVNSDILLAALFTCFGWLALRTARVGLTWQRAALLSLVSALAILTHGRGLAIVPALGVALLVAWLVHAKTLRETVQSAVASVGVLALGFVAYRLAANAGSGGGGLYGGEVNLGAHRNSFHVRQLVSNVWQFYLPKLGGQAPRPGPSYGWRQFFIEQYLTGVFGSFEVYFPTWVYDTMQVVVGLLLLAAWTLAVVHWRRLAAQWPKVVIVAASIGSIMLALHVASYRALLDTDGASPLLAGRYGLPLTGFIGVIVGSMVAVLPRRLAGALAVLVVMGLLALSVGGLALNLERFYA